MHRHPELPKAFADLGLEVPLLRALAAMGFKDPSPIQTAMVPLLLEGRDVLGQARTGTGKTAAFGMPLLQRIDPAGHLQAIVLTPTRELAAQVVGEFRRLASVLDLHIVPVYGGVKIAQQLHALGRRPHVVVGTPGRVLDLLGRKALHFGSIRMVVLDEVDRMLDIGFRDDIRRILSLITQPHQTTFVSATLSDEIKRLAKQYMHEPAEVNVSKDELTVEEVSQYYCTVDPWDKFRLLKLLLDADKPKLAIIFTNTKHGARKLAKRLHDAGVPAKEIHGDLIQQKRERIMDRFRKHQIPVLVATDLAARGIDVHRIGRTARMGQSGKAITFVTRDQGDQLTAVEALINREIPQLVVEGFRPRPPPDERHSAAPAMASATMAAVATPPAPPMPKTLGGKFPLSRRHRRR
jgi:ATP-dependent RNA helicase DeaD